MLMKYQNFRAVVISLNCPASAGCASGSCDSGISTYKINHDKFQNIILVARAKFQLTISGLLIRPT